MLQGREEITHILAFSYTAVTSMVLYLYFEA